MIATSGLRPFAGSRMRGHAAGQNTWVPISPRQQNRRICEIQVRLGYSLGFPIRAQIAEMHSAPKCCLRQLSLTERMRTNSRPRSGKSLGANRVIPSTKSAHVGGAWACIVWSHTIRHGAIPRLNMPDRNAACTTRTVFGEEMTSKPITKGHEIVLPTDR